MTGRRLLSVVLAAGAAAACEPLSLDPFLYDPLKAPEQGYELSKAVIPFYEDLFIFTPDGKRLHAIFVRSPGPRADVTLIYFHGQSNNIGSSWERAEFLYPMGYNLVLVDPRGYGRSDGTPSEAGIRIDERAVLALVAKRPDVDPKRLVYYGHSFGGAWAIDLASTHAPAVLVTESTFTSVAALVRDGVYVDLPASFVAESTWDSARKIEGITTPYLALHGTADPYVQHRYSEELITRHPGQHSLVLVPGADHKGVPETMGLAAYRAAVSAFVESVIPTP
jgi:fermentation-respiration switch protein FrsA (DUF1100 family)